MKKERVLRALAAIVLWLTAVAVVLGIITGAAWVLQAACAVTLGKLLLVVGSLLAGVFLLGVCIDNHRGRGRRQ